MLKTEKLKELRNKIKNMVLLDDALFQLVAENKKAMQEIIRIIMNDKNIIIDEVIPQRSLANLIGRAVRLDVLCISKSGVDINTHFPEL